MMEELLGKDGASLLGRLLDTVEPELSLLDTMESGADSRARVLHFEGKDWAVNRTPIRESGEFVDAAIPLYDAKLITEADTRLRMIPRQRQAAASYRVNKLMGNTP